MNRNEPKAKPKAKPTKSPGRAIVMAPGRAIAKAPGRAIAKAATPLPSPLAGWGWDGVPPDVLLGAVFPRDGTAERDEARSGLERFLRDRAAELSGPSPTAVELLLARTAALNWFALRYFESVAAGSTRCADQPMRQFEREQQRVDRSHRRLLSTLRTLESIRRLALPPLQINIGARQVNQINAGMVATGGDNPRGARDEPDPAGIAPPAPRPLTAAGRDPAEPGGKRRRAIETTPARPATKARPKAPAPTKAPARRPK